MIKYIAVDPIVFEQATAHHLELIREQFDKADHMQAYDILQTAIKFYGTDRTEVQQMQKDLKLTQ